MDSLKIFILIVAALLEIYDAYRLVLDEKIRLWKKWLLVIVRGSVIAGLCYFTISEINAYQDEQKVNALSGTFAKHKVDKKTVTYLQLGSTVVGINGDMAIPFSAAQPNTNPPLVVRIDENSEVNIYAEIRDSHGALIADIDKRQWHIDEPTNIQYNNDDSGFEIISGGRVIFQLYFENSKPVFNGILNDEKGNCIASITPTMMLSFPDIKAGNERFTFPDNYSLFPIFRYRRKDFLGKRRYDLPTDY